MGADTLEAMPPVKLSNGTLVEVRPLPGKKWHGKTGKESFAQPKSVEVLYDPATGKYATGLTPEEAAKYGKLTGLDLSDDFKMDEPHPTWTSKGMIPKLENRTMIFDTAKPFDYIKVKNLKASKFVANSMKEYEDNLWPDATHVIFDELEQVSIQATKIEKMDEARRIAFNMDLEGKASMVQVLSNKTVKNRSPNFITVEIEDIIVNQTEKFIQYAKMGKEEVTVRAKVLEALDKSVLTKEGNSIYYMGDMIAIDYEDAVTWFKDPNNSRMKVMILEKINAIR